MNGNQESGGSLDTAERLFADYMADRESGQPDEFEAFVARNRDCERELRELMERWRHLDPILDGWGGPTEEPVNGSGNGLSNGSTAERAPTEETEGDSDATTKLLRRLTEREPDLPRYRLDGELARGGMGIVYRAWDTDLRRKLAMKVILDGEGARKNGDASPDHRTVARFLEEAQVTSQLNHPGIVPLHELGIDADGRAYFTMSLVKGDSLDGILPHAHAGRGSWSVARALSVLLRVCETMAYAHAKGVVHRDLKPSNILVGDYGATYVIDWGLARVLGRPDKRDIRLRGQPVAVSQIRTERSGKTPHRPDSPLVTQDGDVVGTPSFMAPEQARGEVDKVGPRADVYSVGAILYELLAGRAPYTNPTARVSPHGIWFFVLEGPPRPLSELAPGQPPELIAICEKAMSRDASQRYADMREMAADLRAYLEQRVVRAYRTGALVELRKWVVRNRAAAAGLAAAVGIALLAAFAVSFSERTRLRQVRTLTTRGHVEELLAEAWELGPIHPDTAEAKRDWLERSAGLLALEDEYEQRVGEQRERGRPPSEEFVGPSQRLVHRLSILKTILEARPEALARKREQIADDTLAEDVRARAERDLRILQEDTPGLRERVLELDAWLESERLLGMRFASPAERREHERLTATLLGLEELRRERARVLGDVQWSDELIALGERGAEEWRAAIDEIRSSQTYDGLTLGVQFGLVPLGPDPMSGLWEFWHVASGERPERGDGGRWLLTADTGIVLVLMPGGHAFVGAQAMDATGPNYEPRAAENEQPLQEVFLDPYFISKYEMTQGQWLRATGENPSDLMAGSDWKNYGTISWTHPVERVTWYESRRVLSRYGLDLPTEAQWETAARAGGAYEHGMVSASSTATRLANLRDRAYDEVAGLRPSPSAPDDGHPRHAPVDAFEPNPAGLHGAFGNVREWCRGLAPLDLSEGLREGDGAPLGDVGDQMAQRGGGYHTKPELARPSARYWAFPDEATPACGVRPVRGVDAAPSP